MPRAIWKGAITFGLVMVPVALHSATQDESIDFDWLDKRSMDPVGYKRINKRTGEEVDREHIVKGIRQEDGDYVLLSDDEIRAAYPRTTQTIEIESFVDADEIDLAYFEKPYTLEPVGQGAKVYALLREAMSRAGVVGIARLVLHTREHLAALRPRGEALTLNTLRWASEIRDPGELDLPDADGATAPKPAELKMAQQLIAGMTTAWEPGAYADKFTSAIQALVARKVAAGKTASVEPVEAAPPHDHENNVVDLTELLRRSLAGGKPPGKTAAAKKRAAGTATGAKKSPAAARKTTTAKKAPARQAARKRA